MMSPSDLLATPVLNAFQNVALAIIIERQNKLNFSDQCQTKFLLPKSKMNSTIFSRFLCALRRRQLMQKVWKMVWFSMSLHKFKSSRCYPYNQSTQRRRKVYHCWVSSSPIKRAKTWNVQIRWLSSPSRWKPNSLLPMQKRPMDSSHHRCQIFTSRDSNHHRQSVSAGKTKQMHMNVYIFKQVLSSLKGPLQLCALHGPMFFFVDRLGFSLSPLGLFPNWQCGIKIVAVSVSAKNTVSGQQPTNPDPGSVDEICPKQTATYTKMQQPKQSVHADRRSYFDLERLWMDRS